MGAGSKRRLCRVKGRPTSIPSAGAGSPRRRVGRSYRRPHPRTRAPPPSRWSFRQDQHLSSDELAGDIRDNSTSRSVSGKNGRRISGTHTRGRSRGGLAVARPASRFGTASGRLEAIVAFVAGLIAVVNGWLVLAVAKGWKPGTGSGIVGGAGALVLGLIALAIGALALARSGFARQGRERRHERNPRASQE
jgi:hypothetical protein